MALKVLLLLTLVASFCGLPIFIFVGLLALIAFTNAGVDSSAVATEMYRLASSPTLVSLPFFAFAGHLMAASGGPGRLIRFSRALIGWLPGGVGIMAIVTCALFSAFTGASGVTIIALGGLLYPILVQEGYQEKFTLGLLTTAGSLGPLFPPSMPLILYALVAKIDIDDLFRASLVPGLLIVLLLAIYVIYHRPVQSRQVFSTKELLASGREAIWEILLPIFLLGAIYGGVTTIAEAGALTVVYVALVEIFIYHDIGITKELPKIIVDSMSLVGAILLILCSSLGLTNYLIDERFPQQLLVWIQTITTNKYLFLAALNLLLLVVGSIMDIYSAIIVVVPLIAPVAHAFGIHPIHLAIIFFANLEIGYITPPVGINLFIGRYCFKKSIAQLYRASFPFLCILLVALFFITYLPHLSLFTVD